MYSNSVMPPPLHEEDSTPDSVSTYSVVYITALFTLLIMAFVIMCLKIAHIGQKTRNPQQRRMYVGSRARPSVGQAEPSIYVSPCNLPPPPKYECMAPPSYEEVVGVHYPTFQPQPITQPITNALQSSPEPSAPSANNDTVTRINETVQRNTDETVITVPATRTVAATS
ncbi:uncharacterized protein LOC113503192 isoform X3 [Trichoplusia ni]|uniref:Uncharacterized protein LOC113503192 isoform X3 n=1 Tax=Trichoplusia ni TaxID=7111 RepID=A0A7E5WKG9_TRINI|nr:uncharacterized protein LOC113503192 isoform X3 [Trichoplusia ni]